MADAPDILYYARDCTRLAETTSDDEDHAILLEMAKAWTYLAVLAVACRHCFPVPATFAAFDWGILQ